MEWNSRKNEKRSLTCCRRSVTNFICKLENLRGDRHIFRQSDDSLRNNIIFFYRKRILQSLMDVTVSQSEEVVNELNNIEQQITQLKAAYEKAPNASK